MTDSFAALIFDCDGVLVNSEEISQQAELRTLKKFGLHYPREEFVLRFTGTSTADFNEALSLDYRQRFNAEMPEEFFSEMDAAIRYAYDTALEIIPGADHLARAWPHAKAVASSSSYQLVELKLSRVGLGDVFGDSIFTADDIRAKPHPDLFLASADHLRTHPDACVVVEDSVNGVIAAKRAGMKVIGFVGGGHCLPNHSSLLSANGADWVFDSYQEIAQLLLS